MYRELFAVEPVSKDRQLINRHCRFISWRPL